MKYVNPAIMCFLKGHLPYYPANNLHGTRRCHRCKKYETYNELTKKWIWINDR